MANTNGNVYPALGINAQNQVFGVDSNNNIHLLSAENFAQVIAISENGTIWAISTDPVSGGAQISWSIGDGNWTPVNNDPGAVLITGTTADGALYYTESETLWAIQTAYNEGEQIGQIPAVQNLDYGGGYLWMVAPIQPNTEACLQFTPTDGTYNWKPFAGLPEPSSISVNYMGDCYGVNDFSPVYYSSDGTNTGSDGSGATGSALEITFKNTYYVLSTNGNENGNDVLIWEDVNGGTFVSAGFQAIQVLGTYYLAGS